MSNPFVRLLKNPTGVEILPLAGDASGREYFRWQHPEFPPMIHMDARNDRAGSCDDFVHIADHLRRLEISAPQTFARDGECLLIEDLGDNIYAKVLLNNNSLEEELYISATDLLLRVQQNPPPNGLKTFQAKEMSAAIEPAFEWYLKGTTGQSNKTAMTHTVSLFEKALSTCEMSNPVMILRDYHAENLLWLPDRDGVAKCGVLDFQDALLGHAAYDLASLLEDARRDVSEETRASIIDHFVVESDVDAGAFMQGFSTQAAQRNLRILGVLSRLAIKDGKTHYLSFLPRVWDHLLRDLEHPALALIKTIILDSFPPPSPKVLLQLGSQNA